MRFLRLLARARMLKGNRRRSPYGYGRTPYRGGGGLGPRHHRRGSQVRVVGCGPGCLMTSLLLSIALTVLVNVIIRLF